jgi:MHS family shikimate/dehydroshikimate transporter-like MFS transporter
METAASRAAPGAPSASTVRKVALAAAAGSSIEWYDFFIYGTAAALVFGELFFPTLGPTGGTLAAFLTFWVAFVARPIGGIAFGHYGDKLGRKPVLVIALLIMGAATFLVGVLPTYETIGVLAPIALVVLRFAQGLAVGGQWGGAMLLATEYAPPGKRGFYGSFAQIGVPIGIVLGNGMFLVLGAQLSDAEFAAWGWRVPFLVSIALIGIAMYVQLRIEDTPAFRQLQELRARAGAVEQRSPVVEVIRTQPKQILLAAGAFLTSTGAFYITVTGMLDYGQRALQIPESTILAGVLIASALNVAVLPASAALSDRLGRRPVYLAGAALTALWAFPLFWLVETARCC